VVQLAVAGHPLPVLLTADGAVTTVGTPGTLLGVLPETRSTDVMVELGPGDTLLMFTDGVLDSGDPGPLRSEGLHRILAGCRGLSPREIVGRVHHAAARGQRDDVAVIALAAS
jgi:serine phosphatase RsbU (regulator of sigma subunit)